MKRFYSLVSVAVTLSVLLAAIGVMALPVSAEGNTYISDKGSVGNIYWELDSEGTLTVSGEGDLEYANYYNDEKWNDIKKNIKRAVIEDGITCIGKEAFIHCVNLKSIYISESVENIYSNAFSNCGSLATVYICSKDIITQIENAGSCGYLTNYAESILVKSSLADYVSDELKGHFYVETELWYDTVEFVCFSDHHHNWTPEYHGSSCTECNVLVDKLPAANTPDVEEEDKYDEAPVVEAHGNGKAALIIVLAVIVLALVLLLIVIAAILGLLVLALPVIAVVAVILLIVILVKKKRSCRK